MKPVIDKDKCSECGACMEECMQNVFDVVDTAGGEGIVTVLNPSDCIMCKVCAEECPEDAITFEE